MPAPKRQPYAPVRRYVLAALSLAWIAGASAAMAESGMVEVNQLPRLAGAQETTDSGPDRVIYTVQEVVPSAVRSVNALMADNGWVQYARPLDETATSLLFKKGKYGLSVSFTQALGRPDRAAIYYSANRIYADVPFPQGATDIIYDERRPYLSCTAPSNIDANLDFFQRELAASGWVTLSAEDAKARWPNAAIDDKIDDGARAYFRRDDRDKQLPVMVSLRRLDDNKTAVDIRVAPFALPQDLQAGPDMDGLPRPDRIINAGTTGNATSERREAHATVIAEMPAVLAFYRRELAAHNWKEEAKGAIITPDEVSLNFTSAEETGTLKLGHKYDLTLASFVMQVTPTALAARARAKKQADNDFMKDAMSMATELIAADNGRRAQQSAKLSDAPLHAQTTKTSPIPLPEGAENVEFDGTDGKLEFESQSSVKALAGFYRSALKPLGWKAQPSVINNPNMAALQFSKGGKEISITVMQMGPKTNVSANGSGLEMANAGSGAADDQPAAKGPPKPLEAEPDSALPVPKEHTLSSLSTGKLPGSDAPFRQELEASIPADLASVLAFYREELGKRGWKELPDRAISQPDRVQLAFTSPDGPAMLKLGRRNAETTVNLAQKIPAAAAKGEVLPKPGQARLMLGNMGQSDATITINKQTIKLAAGAGGPQSSQHPALDLPPGKYKYTTKVGGHAKSGQIDLEADDAWGLMLGPDGDVLALQAY
ncbi:hypothetical protein [Nitrobacter sp. JJSN]|uniref:hypothetical protein n=1 Tax=Nitrobacter sp. JJSN TaxID=3453033 RepID=UPI003F769454